MVGKASILVVDDDRLVLATVTHGLVQAGYAVIDADNGDDAILLARQHKPDLALLDIRMHGKSGFDVAEYLRDVAHTPFMFLSAFSDAATVAKVQSLGAVAYLVKPLDVAQIVPAVEAALGRVRSAASVTQTVTQTVSQTLTQAVTQAVTLTAPLTVLLTSPAEPLGHLVPIAVGLVMHRYSLSRAEALARLERLALEQNISLLVQAERLVLALEELARTAR